MLACNLCLIFSQVSWSSGGGVSHSYLVQLPLPFWYVNFLNLGNINLSNLMCIHYIHTGIFEFLHQNVPPTSQPSIDQMQQLAQHQEQLKALHAQYLLQQQAMQQQLFRYDHVRLTSNFAGICHDFLESRK